MIATHHREKLINAILYFSTHTQFCGKTKLLKLLYFLDFRHFKKTGKSVTGLNYFAWKMGPVPRDLFEELSHGMRPDLKAAIHQLPEEGFQKIQPKKRFDDQYFSKNEMNLLKELSYIFENAKADEMIEATHLKNEPWDRTFRHKGEFKEIDYLLSVDGDGDSLSYEEAKDRMEERSEIYSIFGGR